MKKKYPVINNKYVVDKEASIETGDDYLEHTQVKPDRYSVFKANFDDSIENSFKLLATIGEENRIQGLPVIVFEDNDDVERYNRLKIAHEERHAKLGDIQDIKECYYYKGRRDQAAEEKGRWIDEDMLKIANFAQNGVQDKTQEQLQSFMERLKQPQITEIELEVEEIHYCKVCNSQGLRHCAHPEECGQVIDEIGLKITHPNDKGGTIIIQKPL